MEREQGFICSADEKHKQQKKVRKATPQQGKFELQYLFVFLFACKKGLYHNVIKL
ncbi:hypothetical protein IscW_ISCW014472 [Ixodes scapularis]|uniref:Uncharacterized protein n=1 Tax=Ixodes scapularis TaxID=6945 RepID=B7QIB2_IXOSC|nr:hypothetical protein IscW_ISCW014472 [Ixodes scapularis]|eukprot:XP_002414919.1 hypothetical protein IscW_ISCW014472 [Ixodes scapularis]